MKHIGILIATLILMVPALVGADEILLKNGSRMTGTITALDAQHVKIQTTYGVLDVPRADIQSAVIGAELPKTAVAPAPGSATTAVAGPHAPAGLVAAYALNGNADDSSGHSFNGAVKGSPVWCADRFGKEKRALAFKGNAADYIEINNQSDLNPQRLSISAWVTGDSPRLWARIVNKYNYNAKKGYALFYNHKEKTIAFDGCGTDGKGLWVQTQHKLEKGWQHVCITYDGAVLRMYYNGKMEKESKVTRTIRHTDTPLTIGSGNDGYADYPWSGKIDDVRIYNRALNSKEVAALYQKNADSHPGTDLTKKDSI